MRFRIRPAYFIALGCIALLVRVVEAQSPAPVVAVGRPNATRQELTSLAAAADSSAKQSEGDAIRARLRDGDFRAGDRIVVEIQGDSSMHDTVVVRSGPTLKVLSLREDTIRGVLRSELQSHVAAFVTRYLKNTTVRVVPLIRFGVLGEVNRPGYYRLPVDIGITDAIMAAGGPTQRADMPRTILRRPTGEVISKSTVRQAMARGLTLDQLGIDAGDELVVGGKRERNWMNLVQVATLITGIAVSLHASRAF